MPMRERRALYPPDWDALAAAVKLTAGWCCEQCGQVHAPAAGYTLTVHHIDGDPAHNAPENLVALCQRCHLALHARRTWIGQWMFAFFTPPWLRLRQQAGPDWQARVLLFQATLADLEAAHAHPAR